MNVVLKFLPCQCHLQWPKNVVTKLQIWAIERIFKCFPMKILESLCNDTKIGKSLKKIVLKTFPANKFKISKYYLIFTSFLQVQVLYTFWEVLPLGFFKYKKTSCIVNFSLKHSFEIIYQNIIFLISSENKIVNSLLQKHPLI